MEFVLRDHHKDTHLVRFEVGTKVTLAELDSEQSRMGRLVAC